MSVITTFPGAAVLPVGRFFRQIGLVLETAGKFYVSAGG